MVIVVWLGCPSLPGRASRFAGGHRLAGQLLYLLPELVITQRQSAEGGLTNVFNQRCRQLLAK